MDGDRQLEYPCDNCEYKRMLMRTADVHFSGDDCPIECRKYNEWKEKNKLQGSRASVGIIDEWFCVDERKEKKNGKSK